MKVNIDVDLTPEEARALMGLPDVQPMQENMLKKLEAKMNESLDGITDPEYLFSKYLPVGVQSMEQMRDFFFNMANTKSGKADKDAKS